MSNLRSPTRLAALFVVACAVGLIASGACAFGMPHPQKAEKHQIEALEQQWRTATLAGDVTSIDRMLSDDYVGILWNGQVNTKAMQMDNIRSRSLALTRLDVSDTRVKLLGNVAIVTAKADVTGNAQGLDIAGTFRYTRVYQRLPSGIWKITNFEVTRVPEPGEQHRHHGATPDQPASAPPQ